MTNSSDLDNNSAERILKNKHKYRYNDKECETFRNIYKDCECFLKYTNFKDDLVEYICLCCNKS